MKQRSSDPESTATTKQKSTDSEKSISAKQISSAQENVGKQKSKDETKMAEIEKDYATKKKIIPTTESVVPVKISSRDHENNDDSPPRKTRLKRSS